MSLLLCPVHLPGSGLQKAEQVVVDQTVVVVVVWGLGFIPFPLQIGAFRPVPPPDIQ